MRTVSTGCNLKPGRSTGALTDAASTAGKPTRGEQIRADSKIVFACVSACIFVLVTTQGKHNSKAENVKIVHAQPEESKPPNLVDVIPNSVKLLMAPWKSKNTKDIDRGEPGVVTQKPWKKATEGL